MMEFKRLFFFNSNFKMAVFELTETFILRDDAGVKTSKKKFFLKPKKLYPPFNFSSAQ